MIPNASHVVFAYHFHYPLKTQLNPEYHLQATISLHYNIKLSIIITIIVIQSNILMSACEVSIVTF